MKIEFEKTITINDEEEIESHISNIISDKNYGGYEVGPLYSRFENDKIVHGYTVYFYDNDGNVVDIITFKFE